MLGLGVTLGPVFVFACVLGLSVDDLQDLVTPVPSVKCAPLCDGLAPSPDFTRLETMDAEALRVIQHNARAAVMYARRLGTDLDFTEASIRRVDALLEELAQGFASRDSEDQDRLVEAFGCYLLVVGFNAYGGVQVSPSPRPACPGRR